MEISPLLPLSSMTASITALALPLFGSSVSAGFPSPADDFIEAPLDLNEHLIRHPAATFYARAQGDSMIGQGIFDGDLLIIDRATPAQHGDTVIAAIDGELTCKTLDLHSNMLRPGNTRYPPIPLHNDINMVIEGVVIHSVRYHRCPP